MKRILCFIIIAAGLPFLSCTRGMSICEEDRQPMETGMLIVNVAGGDGTKAAYTDETATEKKISNIQLLIFHEDGSLAYYKDMGTSLSEENIALTCGEKTVWAVANAPELSYVSSLPLLRSVSVELADHNDPASDFIMAGSNTVTVGVEPSVDVEMSRFVSRIVLNKVTNALPEAAGKLTVENVYLSNVVGNQTLSEGSDRPSVWYNQMGRATDAVSSSAVIDGNTYQASAPKLTFKTIGRDVSPNASLPGIPYLLYSYPNDSASAVYGWSGGFTPRKTCLVVTASFGGNRYYYQLAVGPTVRNNTYSVDMTITGPGSDDPGKPVEKGSFNAVITTQSWQGKTEYTEII